MKYRILAITVLLSIGLISCNSPSGHHDIAEGVIENNLSGNWMVTIDIVNISENQAYSTRNIDDEQGPIDKCFSLSLKLNTEYLAPEEILEFLNILTGHHIGVAMELQILNNEHHYEAALGIADFENDILANLNEGAIRDVIELYFSTETDSKQLSVAGVFENNKLVLSLDEGIFQFKTIGELAIDKDNVYTLNGDFSWNTDYFLIQGNWTATRSK